MKLRLLEQATLIALATLPLAAGAQTINLTNGVQKYASLASTTVNLSGRCELWVTNSATPLSSCTINLNSPDAWLFLPGVKPSVVGSTYLGQVRVSGATALADSNVRVVQHGAVGTVVIPHSSSFQPLQVFSGPHFSGSAVALSQHVYYRTTQLGALNGTISSFKLKRGYLATLAQNSDGSGISRNYVAQDGDLEVSVLPGGFDDNIRFVYVSPWRWVAKKGSCDIWPGDLNASWWYNWNISENSPRDMQYVAIKQQPYWPGLSQNWQTRGVNHLLGFNEPNNPVEDAYKNLTPPGSVSDAVARWPELLGTGLRVGAPAVTDGGQGWITDFMNQANAAGHRVDFVPVHYYRSYWNNNDPQGAANNLYNYLKAIYDMSKRPIWVTEFNNGANWTGDADPTFDQNRNVIEAMINMMDGTPWIERYSIYSAVEEVRQVYYNAGGLTPMGLMYRGHVSPLAYLQGLPSNGTRSHAQLRFDTNTLDSSGCGNNGVTSGTPAYTNGHRGQALVFDGANTKVTLPTDIATGSAFTFAAWVYWKGGANWQRIFDFGNSTTHYLFLTPNSGGNLRFAIKNGGSEEIVQTTTLTQNQWRHVAVTLSGNTARLYVNGAPVAVNTSMTISPASFSPRMNFLGASQFPDPLFNGLMDEVLITDSALTAAQIAALLTNTSPQFTSGSLTRSATGTDVLYFDTVAGTAVAANPADKITYTKTTGPSWLSVSADGALGGVPTDANLGTNAFTVQASDPTGLSAYAVLGIVVTNSPKMVARLDFESNTGSSVGTAHGILTGPASYVAGQSGQAIDLNGTTNYITLPAGVANSDDFTIAAWVNWDGGGNWQRIFDFGNGTADNMFLTPSSGSNLRFSLVVGGVGQELNTSVLPTGSWQHVVVTRSGNIGRMYRNGAQVAVNGSMTFKPSSFNPTRNYIGKSQWPDPLFNGRVDGFCIYNYALSAAQVVALYTNTPPAFTADPITLPNATPDVPYSGTIAGSASSSLGPITYGKAGGPAWLKVNGDGSFTGTAHAANAGLNAVAVRATDAGPTSTDATMLINVAPAAGAIGILGFERNTLNTVGGNHGTAVGSPAYVAGVNGRAINFDALDDYVTLPAGLVNVNDLTIATWVYWNGVGGDWQRVFDFGNNTTQYLFLSPNSPGGRMRFAITTGGNQNQQTLETMAVPTNQWTHVAVTLQGGTTGRLYVNGSLVASNSITLRPSAINPVFNYLGKSQWPDPLFNGRLDDFHIHNRALAPDEIAGLANPSRFSNLDGLMFAQTVQPGAPLTVSVPGVAGRIYTLWRGESLPGAWTAILTNGPVASDDPVLLTDPTPPADGAFYRTSLSIP